MASSSATPSRLQSITRIPYQYFLRTFFLRLVSFFSIRRLAILHNSELRPKCMSYVGLSIHYILYPPTVHPVRPPLYFSATLILLCNFMVSNQSERDLKLNEKTDSCYSHYF